MHLKRSFFPAVVGASIVALLFTFICTSTAAGEGSPTTHVLVLNSYHPGYSWSDNEMKGLLDELKQGGLIPHIEYLDAKNFPEANHWDSLLTHLKEKYKDIGFAAIVTADNDALRFATANRSKFGNQLPIIFCGVNGSTVDIAKLPDVFGVPEVLDINGTIELARSLQPDLKGFYVVIDYAATGTATVAAFKQTLGFYGNELRFDIAPNLAFADLAAAVRTLPGDSAVLVLTYSNDGAGAFIDMPHLARIMSASSNRPVYVVHSEAFGQGTIGGSLLDGRRHGKAAGAIAIEVVKGRKPHRPIESGANSYDLLVDYEVLGKYGLEPSRVPPNFRITNSPISVWHAHFKVAFTSILVFFGMVIIIALLWINILRRRTVERTLRVSEQRFRTIFEYSTDTMLIHTLDDRIIDINKTGCDVLGFERAELISRSVTEFFKVEGCDEHLDYGRYKENLRVNGFAIIEGQYHGQHKTIPVEVSSRLIRYEGASAVLSCARDISSRVHAEKALIESQAKYRIIAENTGDVIWTLDVASLTFSYVSPSVIGMRGYSAQECIGAHISTCFAPEDFQEALVKLRARIAKYEAGQSEYGVITARISQTTKDGGLVPTEVVSTLIPDENGKAKEIIGVTRDITLQLNAEDKRLEMERRLLHAQKLESLGLLAGGIAHDFNNLLLAIIGNIDLVLNSRSLPVDVKANLEHAMLASRKASKLTNQMLAYSGKGTFTTCLMSLDELAQENVQLFQSCLPKNIKLVLELGESDKICADPSQLQQVIMNLITNSAESIGSAGGFVRCATGSRFFRESELAISRLVEKPRAGVYSYLEVSDNGCGMDAETLGKLFDPFFTTKTTGRGLGMSSVLGIVKGHDGAILVNSAQGKGTCFTILFKAAKGAGETEQVLSKSRTENRYHQIRGRVLVVDDEEMVRLLTCQMFEKLGFEVLTAADGKEAVGLVSTQEDIELILMDLSMPRMDGITALGLIQKQRPDVRVILSSGYAENDTIKATLCKGKVVFLPKPFRLEALKASLGELLITDAELEAFESSSFSL